MLEVKDDMGSEYTKRFAFQKILGIFTHGCNYKLEKIMTKSYKPNNLPDLIPYLIVKDANKSLDFYTKAFGFEIVNKMEEEGKLQHVEMRKNDIVIMFCPEGAMGMNTKAPVTKGVEESISLYCYVEDVDAFYANAIKHGARSDMPPDDRFWGDRMCALTDHDGYKWSFATYNG